MFAAVEDAGSESTRLREAVSVAAPQSGYFILWVAKNRGLPRLLGKPYLVHFEGSELAHVFTF